MSAESPRRSNLYALLLTQARKKLFFLFERSLLLTLRTWQIFANLIMERLTILKIACLLAQIQSRDQNSIRKLVSRPPVLKNYHKKSKIIYEFLSTFLALQTRRQEFIEVESSILSTMLNASKLLKRMVCILAKSIVADKMTKPSKASRRCMCGQSSVCDNEHDYAEQFLSGSNLILRKHKRTENNVFLLLGDEYCMQNYNFVNDFTVAIGVIFLVIVYGLSLTLFVWILRNLKHKVINHSQPVFLVIVLIGVCCNVSTIIPFLDR